VWWFLPVIPALERLRQEFLKKGKKEIIQLGMLVYTGSSDRS
jgi:hypothetical protein